jgi:hypothetical protein
MPALSAGTPSDVVQPASNVVKREASRLDNN